MSRQPSSPRRKCYHAPPLPREEIHPGPTAAAPLHPPSPPPFPPSPEKKRRLRPRAGARRFSAFFSAKLDFFLAALRPGPRRRVPTPARAGSVCRPLSRARLSRPGLVNEPPVCPPPIPKLQRAGGGGVKLKRTDPIEGARGAARWMKGHIVYRIASARLVFFLKNQKQQFWGSLSLFTKKELDVFLEDSIALPPQSPPLPTPPTPAI